MFREPRWMFFWFSQSSHLLLLLSSSILPLLSPPPPRLLLFCSSTPPRWPVARPLPLDCFTFLLTGPLHVAFPLIFHVSTSFVGYLFHRFIVIIFSRLFCCERSVFVWMKLADLCKWVPMIFWWCPTFLFASFSGRLLEVMLARFGIYFWTLGMSKRLKMSSSIRSKTSIN